jgi:hypothetical protein
VILVYTIDTKQLSQKELCELRDEHKFIFFVGRNSMYTDLGHYWINIRGVPKESPAGIEFIGSHAQFTRLVLGKEYLPLNHTHEDVFLIGIPCFLTESPVYEDGSCVKSGKYILTVTNPRSLEDDDLVIEGEIEGKRIIIKKREEITSDYSKVFY